MAAIVAGELIPGESVGVELCLPSMRQPLQMRALVRHQARLRCGIEFVGLSAEQRAMIRHWSGGEEARRPSPAGLTRPAPAGKQRNAAPRRSWRQRVPTVSARILWIVSAACLAIALIGWWNWYQAWRELESRLPARMPAAVAAARVPAQALEQRVTHRVDPVYPAAAEQARVEGVVLVDTTIAPDGRVLEARAISGPQELAPAAASAVRWWRFQPYEIDGKPAAVESTVAVEFRAPR